MAQRTKQRKNQFFFFICYLFRKPQERERESGRKEKKAHPESFDKVSSTIFSSVVKTTFGGNFFFVFFFNNI